MRTVIWIVVGILVVAGVGFFIYARSQAAGNASSVAKPQDVKAEADRLVKKTEGYVADRANLQDALARAGKLTDSVKAKLAQMDAKIKEAQDKIKAMAAATGKTATDIKKEIVKLQKEIGDIKRDVQKSAKG